MVRNNNQTAKSLIKIKSSNSPKVMVVVSEKIKNNGVTPCKQKFNIRDAKKCGAKTRGKTPCKSPAMKNGRCRMHGGKSTGAITREGIRKIRRSNLIHGKYTKEWIALHRENMKMLRFGGLYLKLVGAL